MKPFAWLFHFTFQAGVSAVYELMKNDFEFSSGIYNFYFNY